MNTSQRPRVDKQNGYVCLHHGSLGLFEVFKIKKNGKIKLNKKGQPISSLAYADTVDEAFSKINTQRRKDDKKRIERKPFKTVEGSRKVKAKGWAEYAEAVWAFAMKQ